MKVIFPKEILVGIIIGLVIGLLIYAFKGNNDVVSANENIQNHLEENETSSDDETSTTNTPTYNEDYFSQLFNIPVENILKFKNYKTIEGITYDLYTFDDEFGDTLEAAIMISKDSSKKEDLKSHELYVQ